jgi:uncharacterized membrane protein YoaK (UPF0700 family)
MLRKFSNSRTLEDNIKLGSLTAFSSGMVNVASVIIFFAFTSNVTGHYAILAEEIAKGHWHQAAIVFGWIFLFFFGNFVSNFIVINVKNNAYLAHALPLTLEIVCLLTVGVYGQYFYEESLRETEFLVGIMLFAMGLQNGLTASISNFGVKTTHLTGLTTDLGVLASMFTKKEFRSNPKLMNKGKLLIYIASSYLLGGIVSGFIYLHIEFRVFFVVSIFIVFIIIYDYSKLKMMQYLTYRRRNSN